MALGEVDSLVVVDRSPGRKVLSPVVVVVADQVRHLLALDIDHFQILVFFQDEGDTATRCYDVHLFHGQVMDISSQRGGVLHCIERLRMPHRNPSASD